MKIHNKTKLWLWGYIPKRRSAKVSLKNINTRRRMKYRSVVSIG